jgi:hypothetical protein
MNSELPRPQQSRLSERWDRNLNPQDPELSLKQQIVSATVESIIANIPSHDQMLELNMFGELNHIWQANSHGSKNQPPRLNRGHIAVIGPVMAGKSTLMRRLQNDKNIPGIVFTEKAYSDLTGKYNDIGIYSVDGQRIFKLGDRELFRTVASSEELTDLERLLAYTHLTLTREIEVSVMMHNLRNNMGYENILEFHQMGLLQILAFIFASAGMREIPPQILTQVFAAFGAPQQLVILEPDPQVRAEWKNKVIAAVASGELSPDEWVKRKDFFAVEDNFSAILQAIADSYCSYCEKEGLAGSLRILDTAQPDGEDIESWLKDLPRDADLALENIERAFALALQVYLQQPLPNVREDNFRVTAKVIVMLDMLCRADQAFFANSGELLSRQEIALLKDAIENSLTLMIEKLSRTRDIKSLLGQLDSGMTLKAVLLILEHELSTRTDASAEAKHGLQAVVAKLLSLEKLSDERKLTGKDLFSKLLSAKISKRAINNLHAASEFVQWEEQMRLQYPTPIEALQAAVENGVVPEEQFLLLERLFKINALPLDQLASELTLCTSYEQRDEFITSQLRDFYAYISNMGRMSFATSRIIETLKGQAGSSALRDYILHLVQSAYVRCETLAAHIIGGNSTMFEAARQYAATPYISFLELK